MAEVVIVKGSCLKAEAQGATPMRGAQVSFAQQPEYGSVGTCLEAATYCSICPANKRVVVVERTDGIMSAFRGTDVEITFTPTPNR